MTTFNTGNQIGSVDPRDLYDNAENLDTAANTKTDTTWTDRLGVERKTFHGMEVQFDSQQVDFEDRFNVALQGIGYDRIGEYGAGLEITEYNQIFRHDGEWWRASASLELPYTTTGDWATEGSMFVGTGDALLRQELGQPDGAKNVGYESGSVYDELANINTKTDDNSSDISDINSLIQGSGSVNYLVDEGKSLEILSIKKQPQRIVTQRLSAGHYDHFGIFDQLPTGELFTMFRRGSSHESDLGAIFIAIQNQHDGSWEERPVVDMSDQGLDAFSVAGGVAPNGQVLVGISTRTNETNLLQRVRDTYIYASDDYGKTFYLSQVVPVPSPGNFLITYGKLVILSGGDIGIPYYERDASNGFITSGILIKEKGSDEFLKLGVVNYGQQDYNETAIVHVGNGVAIAMARINNTPDNDGKFAQFISHDNGRTFTAQGVIDVGGIGVAPTMELVYSTGGTPYLFLFFANRSNGACWAYPMRVSELISGVYRDPDAVDLIRIYSAPNESGYQGHTVVGRRIYGVLFRSTTTMVETGAYFWEMPVGELPDFDTGWLPVSASQTYTIPHGLARVPSRVEVGFSSVPAQPQLSVVGATYFNDGENKGSGAEVTYNNNDIIIRTGHAVYGSGYFSGSPTRYTDGFYKIKAFL